MAWVFTHTYDSVTTDISQMLLTREISFTVNGSPVSQAIQLTLANTDGWSPNVSGEINIEYNGTLLFRGWITALERKDLGDVAGMQDAQAYHLIVADIYQWLKTTYVPTAGQKQDGYKYSTRELEQPVGLRDEPAGTDPGKLNISPKNMILWALDLIRDIEGRKANPAMPLLSIDGTHIANPTTQIPDGNGGLTDFRYKYCPFVADGQDYFSLLDSICQLAGLMWRIRPDLKLETWDAQNPPTSTIELVDGDASSGRVQQVVGGTWQLVRSLDMNEDISRVANRVRVTYVPNPDTGKRKAVTVNNIASQEAWGIRERKIVTEYRTKQMAEAIARRALATDKNPNIRGAAQAPFNANLLPGRRIWVHRTGHPEGATYWRRRAYISGVTLLFQEGYEGPLWCQLELDQNIYSPPSFSPFVPPKDVAPTVGSDTPGESTVGAPSPDAGAMLPKDGTVYITPGLLPGPTIEVLGYTTSDLTTIYRTLDFTDPSGYNRGYYGWGIFPISLDTAAELYDGQPFSGRDFKFHTRSETNRLLIFACGNEVTTQPLEAKVFIGVNNVYTDDRKATQLTVRQLPGAPKYTIDDVASGYDVYGGAVRSDLPIYPGSNADFDDVADWLWNNPSKYNAGSKTFSLAAGMNRLSMPIAFQKVTSTDPRWAAYVGRYCAFLVVSVDNAIGGMLPGLGSSLVRIGGTSSNPYLNQTVDLISGLSNYSSSSFYVESQNGWQINLDAPTTVTRGSTTRTLNFDASSSAALDDQFYTYAIVQTAGTTGWSGGGNGTVPTEETDGGGNTSDGFQSPDGSVRIKMGTTGIGQTVFELPSNYPLAVPGTLKVWVFYGTIDFNRAPLASVITYQRDGESGIYKFDIYPSVKYGMQPKTTCWAEYEPIFE